MKSSILQAFLLIILLTGLVVSACQRPTGPEEQVSQPVFSPAGGTYDSGVEVSITTSTLGTTILYTSDGSDPNSGSPVYSGPIEVLETTTLKAKAYRPGMKDSATATASYTIEQPFIPENFVFVEGGTIYPSDGHYTDGLTASDFYIGKYELTSAEWNAIMGSGGGDNYPHAYVSWFGAIEYCNRRSLQEGLTPCYRYLTYGTNPDDWPSGWNDSATNAVNVFCNWTAPGYRLPSESEWEYAAQGGLHTQGYTYSGSNDLNLVGWYLSNSGYSPHPVGQLAANELGIFDMSGNVWEWVWDTYYWHSSRVIRGGGLDSFESACIVSYRDSVSPTFIDYAFGFRVCRSSP